MLLNFLCRNSGFLFLLLKKLFKESSGSVYYSIFDFQGTVGLCFSIGWLKQTLLRKAHPFGLWSVRDDFSDEKSFPAISRLERQPVYLSIGEICCQAIFLFFRNFLSDVFCRKFYSFISQENLSISFFHNFRFKHQNHIRI